ncbi:MAG: hypothetical protein ABI624_25510, partial [Casimicrobiaceae bacterium]
MAGSAAGPFAPGGAVRKPQAILITPALRTHAPRRAWRSVASDKCAAVTFLVVCAWSIGTARAEPPSALPAPPVPPVPELRLPRDVVPLAYDPVLRIDPAGEIFSGTIEIKVRVLEPTDFVWLNAKGLTLREARGTIPGPPDETVAATPVPGSDNV